MSEVTKVCWLHGEYSGNLGHAECQVPTAGGGICKKDLY